MRSLAALLVLLLLASLQLTSSAVAVDHPDCCTKHTTVKIPLKAVKSYSRTSSNCALKAIVITTKIGKKFCVDPDAEWVSNHVAALDRRPSKTTAMPKTTNTTTNSIGSSSATLSNI